MIWFTSELCLYSYKEKETECYNQYIIDSWNEKVSPEDTVYVLGGLFRSYPGGRKYNILYAENIVKQLNGKIYLIPNSDIDDVLLYSSLDRDGLIDYQSRYDIEYNNILMILSISPINATQYITDNYTKNFTRVVNLIGSSFISVEDLFSDVYYLPVISSSDQLLHSIQTVFFVVDKELYLDTVYQEDDLDDIDNFEEED
jgi:calcineurin-like phosphoesterase family protein